jgi:hypothetical protein
VIFDGEELTLFPTGPTARPTDPETSQTAVPSPAHLSFVQQEVMAFHRAAEGMTDDELCLRMSWRCEGTVKKRRTELSRVGALVDSGVRRPTRTGTPAIVWEVADAYR